MLLYDRVLEFALREVNKCGAESFSKLELGILKDLSRAVVYDLSSCLALESDWARERDHAIPKKSPHPVTWAEWVHCDVGGGGEDVWEIGALIIDIGVGAMKRNPVFCGSVLTSPFWTESMSILSDDDPGYIVRLFQRLRKNGQNRFDPSWDLGHPSSNPVNHLVCMRPDGTLFRVLYIGADAGKTGSEELIRKHGEFFGLDILRTRSAGPKQGPFDPLCHPWPAFMAFSLLHCKNVVAEDNAPDEKTQRECKKHKRPPRVTYKTLRIEVPQSCHKRQTMEPGAGDDDGPRTRFHLCRGHFKNLQHERYKNKGWHWWPAHWRGSTELGRVTKDYRLEGKA